jgi:hypothetical protein
MLDKQRFPMLGYRVSWAKSGLLWAEGHPDPEGGLCSAERLPERLGALLRAFDEAGLGLCREVARPLAKMAGSTQSDYLPMGRGFAGFGRVDATVNLAMAERCEGLAVLAGIAAAVRDSPGKANIFYGPDRSVETVALLSHAGKRMLGRWYDKALEAAIGPRGTVIRGEDQRRWPKEGRRALGDLTAAGLRSGFHRRFYPLYKATKGVTVAGPLVIVEKLAGLRQDGAISAGEMEKLAGHLVCCVGLGRGGAGLSRETMYRRERRIREFGLQLADGVLEEVEVDVGEVLEQALETDAWERRG